MNKKLILLCISIIYSSNIVLPAAPAASSSNAIIDTALPRASQNQNRNIANRNVADTDEENNNTNSWLSRLTHTIGSNISSGAHTILGPKAHAIIFGKDFFEEYWKEFNINDTLKTFQNEIFDKVKSKETITRLINMIGINYSDAVTLLFTRYYAKNAEIMNTISKDLTKRATIKAFPTSPNIFVIRPHEVSDLDLSAIAIPTKKLSHSGPDYIHEIDSTWLLNLHIDHAFSKYKTLPFEEYQYAHFNYLKLKSSWYSDNDIIEIAKTIQADINSLYEKDLKTLEKRRRDLITFIITKFTDQTPTVHSILFSIDNPNNVEILLKSDSAEEIRNKMSRFIDTEKKLEARPANPALQIRPITVFPPTATNNPTNQPKQVLLAQAPNRPSARESDSPLLRESTTRFNPSTDLRPSDLHWVGQSAQ